VIRGLVDYVRDDANSCDPCRKFALCMVQLIGYM
jgi:hypothetical protein